MRFRATGNIIWEFECESQIQAQELANKHLGDIPVLDGQNDLRLIVKLDKIKEKAEKIKLAEFKIEEVLPFVSKNEAKKEFEYNGITYFVRMNSQRYFLFRACSKCVACGLKGTKMLLECHPSDGVPHFNLYGEEDNQLVLFTKDHIQAKSFGGKDLHSNYQTMCITCNNLKSHLNLELEDVFHLRKLYNKNKNKVTKKQLHNLIEDERKKLAKPWPKKRHLDIKTTGDVLKAACDLSVYQYKDEFIGKSVYDGVLKNHKHIACIKKGSYIEPLVSTKDKTLCVFGDDNTFLLHNKYLKAID